jgi:DNA topoisomerase II
MSSTPSISLSIKSNTNSKKKIKIKKEKAQTKNAVDANDIYKKMKHREHIYEKPDTYVGSAENEDIITHVFDNENNMIVQKELRYPPAWYKCFDELIVNAHDHKKRMDKQISDMGTKKHKYKPVTTIKVNINENGSISFYNDGDGIHIEYLTKYDMYPVELIFGTLLSSTNFNDNDKREWGGRNGYGAKLANIFGKEFIVETVDHVNKKKLVQTFSNNMKDKTQPTITSVEIKQPYTKITWLPDYKKFNMTGMTKELENIIKKRVYDIAGVTDKKTKVYFNDKQVECREFEKYVDLYIGNSKETKRAYLECLGWQVVATSSDDDVFQHVSYVNGIFTSRGGTHVDYVCDIIKNKLTDYLRKNKKINAKPQIIKNQLKLFVNAYKIINPAFDSQTKETLKTSKNKFGVPFEITDKFIEQLAKTDIVDKIRAQTAYKDSQLLSKTDGKKKKSIKVPKLLDANNAGCKNKSKNCWIIFTEGDSAKSMAVAGLSEVGRDDYGVFPLRGKIQNIRGLSNKKILNCTIINTIKTIIGLQSGINYKKEYEKTGVWPLRYGKLLLMTDQDHDGSHIKGLVMNIFDVLWPELLEMGFVTSMITPIVKAFKKKQEKVFYTLQDYNKFFKKNSRNGWRIKYYKGLGTSSAKEAKEYFKKLNVITYSKDINLLNKLDLAFNSTRAADRKSWLGNYDRNKIPDFLNKKMNYDQFVDEELIHFSNADNIRSIPSMVDGQKPSTRKVLFAAFKRNLKNEIKVAQLAGYTSEHAAYHHGEVSLEGTIKGMGQNYIGSNNYNLLIGIGQFGTRLQGGSDAAQSRYIFSKLNSTTRKLYNENDDVLCKYLDDDGQSIEPEYYYPILPVIAMNGSQGIGTGYSTKIPMYNPLDICKYIRNKIEGLETKPIIPWYRGFRGKIEPTSKGSFITRGTYTISEKSILITELPIGTWTEKYIEELDKMSVERGKENAKQFVRDVIDNSSEDKVHIEIFINPVNLHKWANKIGKDGVPQIENRLKLTSSLSSSNLVAFNHDNKITKYNSISDMIDEWFVVRKVIYVKRREYMLKKLQNDLDIIKYRVQFIEEIVEDKRVINKKKKDVIIKELEDSNYPKFSDKTDGEVSYDYLIKMEILKFSYEEIEKLKHKRDIKQAEFDTLYSKQPSDLWKEDIDEFYKCYEKDYKEYLKEHCGEITIKKKKRIRKKKTSK